MYKTNNIKFPYVKNNKQPLRIEKETVGEDLVSLLKGARFYNHEITKNNRKLLANELFSQISSDDYREYNQQAAALQENQELTRENGFYEYMLESLKYIEKLPQNEYLLVINYLYGDEKDIEETVKQSGIMTRQSFPKKVKALINKAYRNYFRETLNNL